MVTFAEIELGGGHYAEWGWIRLQVEAAGRDDGLDVARRERIRTESGFLAWAATWAKEPVLRRSPEGECEAEVWLGNEEASRNMLAWGPLESLKKAVKCLEHGTPIEIGTEHVNLGIISIYVGREGGPVTWPLNILDLYTH